jgi:hypothetical protein
MSDGAIKGDVTPPTGDRLSFAISGCKVWMQRLGPWLIVSDDGMCPGGYSQLTALSGVQKATFRSTRACRDAIVKQPPAVLSASLACFSPTYRINPRQTEPVAREGGRVVLAHGEVTGARSS